MNESVTHCGMYNAAVLMANIAIIALCLGVALAGLCAAEFSLPARWRLAIACGIAVNTAALVMGVVNQFGPVSGLLPWAFTGIVTLFGTLSILAGVVRRPQ